jgi:glyoxylase-like metal-dependent hydrolase (beta-lactamase superfamily II)
VEEGADHDFKPNHQVPDGAIIQGAGWTLEAVHTPGHTSNHLCFALHDENALFSGDHVMGWSTSVISPPDGDMQAYMHSLRKLLKRDETIYWPTHGAPITDPKPYVESFIAHREDREAQIMACLTDGITTISPMVERMYADVPAFLHPAAARSVLAHLIHMAETGRVHCDGPPGEDSVYSAASDAVGSV